MAGLCGAANVSVSNRKLLSHSQLKMSLLVPVLSVVYLAFLVASVLCVVFEW